MSEDPTVPVPPPPINTIAVEQALMEGRAAAAVEAACDLLELPVGSTPESKVGNTKALAPVGRAVFSVMQSLVAPAAVKEFYALAATRMSEAAMEFLRKPALEELEATAEWSKRLANMAHERLSNDLSDAVKTNDLKLAQQLVQVMIMGAPEGQRPARAKFVAGLLGAMVIERERAHALVRSVAKAPAAFGVDPVVAIDMEEEFVRASNAVARRERPGMTLGRQELTQAAVELSKALPGRMVLAEPTPEQMEVFLRVMRALWRAALTSPGGDWFADVSALLVELSPQEVTTTRAKAGVENRLHSQMGGTARAVASRGLETMGNLEQAYRPYLSWSKAQIEGRTKSARQAIEVLGMLRQPAAIALLKPLLGDREFVGRNEVIFAIGTIADPGSFEVLSRQLYEDLRGRVIDGPKRKEANAIISALGRSTRSLDIAIRSQVLGQIVRLLPEDDTELAVRVALNFFLGNLEGMDSGLLKWGGRIATVALWSADRPELARAGKNAMLGFRQPLVDLCARLLPHAGHEIRQAAMDMAKQYQPGAYLGLGELWYKVADPLALPVLQRLVFNTALHDERSVAATRSVYTRSTIKDAATEEQVDITRDKVLAALIHAMSKCGTPESEEHMATLFQQAQSGQLTGLGQESIEILMRAHQKAGNQLGVRDGASAAEAEDAPPKALTPDDIARLQDLKATYWLANSRRAKKVAAFVHLGQARVAAAIDPAVAHLTDADPIISSAALTCLVDLVSGQGISGILKQQHADALSRALSGKDNPLRVKAAEVLKRVGVKREPWASMLRNLAQNNPSLPLRAVLENVLAGTGLAATRGSESLGATAMAQAAAITRSALGSEPISDPLAKLDEPDPVSEKILADSKGITGTAANSASMSTLEKKREYMLARQAWIKGGKKGPEPQPPG